ncbi:MAG: hypothetical protein HY763_05485 [Planctomycetes bacterium]|nr:hypothetical protein [Planctomycetota bacterium]
MSTTTLTCDQAIFTSIRSPMGEGYRIIAASRGLRPEEKQTITRLSPSHEGLCLGSGAAPRSARKPGLAPTAIAKPLETPAMSYYALPSGRLCVALSVPAGAEHTGRGGQRVYTHSAVFAAVDFANCGYNPFHVFRAMLEAGMATPQLKPPQMLPEATLAVSDAFPSACGAGFRTAFASDVRRYLLQSLLEGRKLVVDVAGDLLEFAEALLLGLPGPMRQKLSTGVGVKFSAGRCHQLHLLRDPDTNTKARVSAQAIELIDPGTLKPAGLLKSEWAVFVDRHWSAADIAGLQRRTGRPYATVAAEARERCGRIYNRTDEVATLTIPQSLELAGEYVDRGAEGVEREALDALLEAARRHLASRLSAAAPDEIPRHWAALLALWRRSAQARVFAAPLVEVAVQRLMTRDPLAAGEAALELAGRPASADAPAEDTLITSLLSRLAAWVEATDNYDVERVRRLRERWCALRPTCPLVQRLHARLLSSDTAPAS